MKFYKVVIPAFTRVEEHHIIQANSEEEALDIAFKKEPLDYVEDPDYYDLEASEAVVKEVEVLQ